MASLDLIYISSDDEKDSSKKIKPKKDRRPQHRATRVGARSKSVDPTGNPRMRIIKRSNSAPGTVSFPSSLLSKSDPTSKQRSSLVNSPGTISRTSISGTDTRTNQSTLSTSSLDPPIEALHFPERYRVALCENTNTRVDNGIKGSESLPTNTSSAIDRPNGHKDLSSPNRSESLPTEPAANESDTSLNPLKRKHDHAATEPPKRPRTATPTYIPRHLPYHPPMGAAQKPAPRGHAPYYSSTSAPAYPLLPTSNPTLWATPAYDPNMDRKVADGANNSSSAPPLLPTTASKPIHSTPRTTETQPLDPPPKTRKRQWNCGMISDLGTELQRTFDAQAFSAKHGMDPKEVLKVFAIYVQQPLSAFSARGLSRAKMKEFKEKMKEHDRKLKETAGDEATGRRRGRKTPVDHVKPPQQERKASQPADKREVAPQNMERGQSNAVATTVHSARDI
ncbi:MAG: hypothetical protein Q9195_004914 [Heterodermia aff. obscurata]